MKIMTDPGHGGHDAGGKSLGTMEKDLVLEFQLSFWEIASQRGHLVVPTRTHDDFVPLNGRSNLANMVSADVFVSIHCNASSSASVRGPWTIYAAPSSRGKSLAEKVQRALFDVSARNPTAFYPDASGWTGGRSLHVLRRTKMPAILLELGFMTNEKDIKLLEDRVYTTRMAMATIRGLEAWNASS